MFRVDLTTRTSSLFTRMASPDFEDFEFLQIIGASPIWALDVLAAESTTEASTWRRFLFADLLHAISIGFGEQWIERELQILVFARPTALRTSVLERVEQIWECGAGRAAHPRFEVVTASGSRFVAPSGESLPRSRQRSQLWPHGADSEAR